MSKPEVARSQCVKLWKLLQGRGFLMRRDLPMNDRTIRAVVEAKPEHFLSCQKGYCLMKEAPTEDIEQSIGHLMSQADKMAAKANILKGVLADRKQKSLNL